MCVFMIRAPDLQRSGELAIVCAPLHEMCTGDPLSGRLPNRTPLREIGRNFACAQLCSGRPDANGQPPHSAPDATGPDKGKHAPVGSPAP